MDPRLTGLGMARVMPGQIMYRLRPWYMASFAIMMITGGLLFWAEAEKLYRSPTFRWKLFFLIMARLNALYYEIKFVPDGWVERKERPTTARGQTRRLVLAHQLGRGDRFWTLDGVWIR